MTVIVGRVHHRLSRPPRIRSPNIVAFSHI
jgi:hypothetical protein